MENLGYLLEDDDISPAVKRRSRTQTAASAQLENVSKTYLFVKRLADVVLSFLAVIVLSVPMLLIALAVFCHPAFQPRTGAVPSGADRAEQKAVHHVQVPHHVRECRTKAGGASCSE